MYENKSAALIGPKIRHARLERGMTLQMLARKAGTSASALHRYEAGWDRFEVSTLRRIASALGARLEVHFVFDKPEPEEVPAKRKLIKLLTPLFWDKKLSVTHLADHPRWVLSRVLMFGDRKQVRAARGFFGDNFVRQTIKHRAIDERTRAYWLLILGRDKHASKSTD
jgi:transcriptional regulator with XRE-family HTH domain